MPEAPYETLIICLLPAIGLKGGTALAAAACRLLQRLALRPSAAGRLVGNSLRPGQHGHSAWSDAWPITRPRITLPTSRCPCF